MLSRMREHGRWREETGMALGTIDRSGESWPGVAPGLREQAVEMGEFLFLIVPSLVVSLFAVQQGSPSFVLVALD
jgi:hypothetical protein